MENKNKKLKDRLNDFVNDGEVNNEQENECFDEECMIKTNKEIVERVNKKIITEDGRQLLF